MTFVLGFTGSREGMTPWQSYEVRKALARLSSRFGPDVLAVHGGCVGADARFHALAVAAGYRVEVHPADMPAYRAEIAPSDQITVHPPRRPMKRNEHIVAQSRAMLACPGGDEADMPRSGTWATIRRARRANVPIRVLPFHEEEWAIQRLHRRWKRRPDVEGIRREAARLFGDDARVLVVEGSRATAARIFYDGRDLYVFTAADVRRFHDGARR